MNGAPTPHVPVSAGQIQFAAEVFRNGFGVVLIPEPGENAREEMLIRNFATLRRTQFKVNI